MILISLASLALAISALSIRELHSHGKLRCQKEDAGFWGTDSWTRKYKMDRGFTTPAKVNWYTKLFKIKYKEAWFTSTNFTVSLTDSYHALQSLSFIFLALSLTFALGFNWWLLGGLLVGIRIVHAVVYRLLQK